jgi:hypothetical protein
MEDGEQWTGCLFEHTRGGVSMRGERTLIAPDGTKEGHGPWRSQRLLAKVRPQEWNSYRIVARGSEITLEINGVVMCQAIDNQAGVAARDGVIALQMHPGPPMKVQFRNLRIKVLSKLGEAFEHGASPSVHPHAVGRARLGHRANRRHRLRLGCVRSRAPAFANDSPTTWPLKRVVSVRRSNDAMSVSSHTYRERGCREGFHVEGRSPETTCTTNCHHP